MVVSHGGVRGLKDDPRNVSDEELRALRSNGGVVGIALGAGFFDRVTIEEHEREVQAVNARIAAKGGWQSLKPEETAAFQKELREVKYRYPQAWGSVRDVVNHVDHVVRTIGIDHVGIGSDFDGGAYLGDCRDVSEYPNLTAELLRRGYSEADIRKIWGGNFLRVLRKVQAIATQSGSPDELPSRRLRQIPHVGTSGPQDRRSAVMADEETPCLEMQSIASAS